jgi:flagellar protein FliO/FliZ
MKHFTPLALLALPAGAAGEAAPAVSATPMLGALLVVVAAIFAAAFLFKRLGLQATGSAAGLLKPVASLSLGPRERLMIVEVSGRWLVLGVTAQSIQTLADVEPKELPAVPAAPPPFATIFARALGRHEKP